MGKIQFVIKEGKNAKYQAQKRAHLYRIKNNLESNPEDPKKMWQQLKLRRDTNNITSIRDRGHQHH